MDLSNWKVSTRLGIAFGAVCLLLVLCVATGLIALERIRVDLQEVVDRNLPHVVASSEVLAQADAIAIALRNMMLNDDAADRSRQTQVIEQARGVITTQLDGLAKTMDDASSSALMQKVQEQRRRYLAGQEELLRRIQARQVAESMAYLNEQLRPALADYKQAIQTLIDAQIQASRESGAAAQQTADNARLVQIMLGMLALLVAAALGWLITRGLLRELGGEPRSAAEAASAVAHGDFTLAIPVSTGDTRSLMAQLAMMRDSLAQVVAQVRRSSDSVAVASSQIAQGNHDLSARTESQASALQETAASMEQLGATVRQNADSAQQANQLARNASEVAVRGGEVVGQVVQTMRGIHESSSRINDIIGVIDGIAFQTNILALNAAVEAARAGEQGRGFAVVAGEVRSLAQRSAEAAKEIKQLIQTSVERVAQGSAMVDQAGETMTEVVHSIRRVNDLMGEISAASSEQASGVGQVGEAVTQMDQVTQQNAALVEEMAAAASSLSTQAQELVQAVALFKLSDAQEERARPAASARLAAQPPAKPKTAAVRKPAKAPALPAHRAVKTAAVSKSPDGGAAGDWESF